MYFLVCCFCFLVELPLFVTKNVYFLKREKRIFSIKNQKVVSSNQKVVSESRWKKQKKQKRELARRQEQFCDKNFVSLVGKHLPNNRCFKHIWNNGNEISHSFSMRPNDVKSRKTSSLAFKRGGKASPPCYHNRPDTSQQQRSKQMPSHGICFGRCYREESSQYRHNRWGIVDFWSSRRATVGCASVATSKLPPREHGH